MLRDEVETLDRPMRPAARRGTPTRRGRRLFALLKEATNPVAIVGGADWSPRAAHHFANFAFRYGIPVAAAFRRQDAICNTCGSMPGSSATAPTPSCSSASATPT